MIQRITAAWAAVVSVMIVTTSIYGCIHYYSPIPYWDQWAEFDFFSKIQQGHYSAWWGQHNEHRIVFSRLLFWIDIRLFGGLNIFTIAANLAAVVGLCAVMWYEYGRSIANRSPIFVASLIVGLLFSWVQYESLRWGFTTCCFAVYLFGMLAFAQYSRSDRNWMRTAAAISFAALAEITLGNGLIVFFILAIQGILLKRSPRDIATIVSAGVLATIAYFYGYVKPPLLAHFSGSNAFLEQAAYFLVFLGNPIYAVMSSLPVAMIFGVLSLTIASIVVAQWYRTRDITSYRSFLIAGYVFVAASAMAAAKARFMLGLSEAASSRYTTPVLLCWVIILLMLLDSRLSRRSFTGISLGSTIILTLLATFQVNANGDNAWLYPQSIGVLGQKIGIEHLQFTASLVPLRAHDKFVKAAQYASQNNLGPYGSGWLHDAGIVRYDPHLREDNLCRGFIDDTRRDDIGLVSDGWVSTVNPREAPILIILVDGAGSTVGYGVSGEYRPDVWRANAGPRNSGWIGFSKSNERHLYAFAYLEGRFCALDH